MINGRVQKTNLFDPIPPKPRPNPLTVRSRKDLFLFELVTNCVILRP